MNKLIKLFKNNLLCECQCSKEDHFRVDMHASMRIFYGFCSKCRYTKCDKFKLMSNLKFCKLISDLKGRKQHV